MHCQQALVKARLPCSHAFLPQPFFRQCMKHRNRRGQIERCAQLYNERRADCTVSLMCSMRAHTESALAQAVHQQSDVLLQLERDHGIGNEQV